MTIQPAMKSFPKPSELAVPAGAEGWETLYPYNLVFQNLSGAEDEKFWFCDSQHWPTVFAPFETIGAEFAVKCLGQYNTRHLLIPPANGIEFKIHLGYLYMSPVPVPEEQIPARVPEFERRAGHYFQNWDSLLEGWKAKVRGTIDEMESLIFDPRTELIQRLQADRCEICKSTDEVQVHHIRKLADLKKKGRALDLYQRVMAARRRKTLVLCRKCHADAHAGRLDGRNVQRSE